MSEIKKISGIIIRKIPFSDSSLILSLYSREFGKISLIQKGALRQSKTKTGSKIDTLNHVEVIIYYKDSRDMQLIKEVDLVDYYPSIKGNLEKLKYSSAIAELLNFFILENYENEELFLGTIKILTRFEDSKSNDEAELFIRYFLFFIRHTGFEINFKKCGVCNTDLDIDFELINFNFEKGFICEGCSQNSFHSFQFSKELFKIITCLNFKKEIHSSTELNNIIKFLEQYLRYHVPEFSGLKSLKMF
ncbi:MAG: DNA repair protein RecO [Melioribacteraceae bacterium]|nr:DNA repair protein RecO [Melioribacteraceae bacterium]